jgi:hypothetical protein
MGLLIWIYNAKKLTAAIKVDMTRVSAAPGLGLVSIEVEGVEAEAEVVAALEHGPANSWIMQGVTAAVYPGQLEMQEPEAGEKLLHL